LKIQKKVRNNFLKKRKNKKKIYKKGYETENEEKINKKKHVSFNQKPDKIHEYEESEQNIENISLKTEEIVSKEEKIEEKEETNAIKEEKVNMIKNESMNR
jgi:hypothetical protein